MPHRRRLLRVALQLLIVEPVTSRTFVNYGSDLSVSSGWILCVCVGGGTGGRPARGRVRGLLTGWMMEHGVGGDSHNGRGSGRTRDNYLRGRVDG